MRLVPTFTRYFRSFFILLGHYCCPIKLSWMSLDVSGQIFCEIIWVLVSSAFSFTRRFIHTRYLMMWKMPILSTWPGEFSKSVVGVFEHLTRRGPLQQCVHTVITTKLCSYSIKLYWEKIPKYSYWKARWEFCHCWTKEKCETFILHKLICSCRYRACRLFAALWHALRNEAQT